MNSYFDATAEVASLLNERDELGGLLDAMTAKLASMSDQLSRAEMTGEVNHLLIQSELVSRKAEEFRDSFTKLVSSYNEVQSSGIVAAASISAYQASRERLEETSRRYDERLDETADLPLPTSTPDAASVVGNNQWRSDALRSARRYSELWESFLAARTLTLSELDALEGYLGQYIADARELARIGASPEAISIAITAESARTGLLASTAYIRERLIDMHEFDELEGLMGAIESLADLPLPSASE